MRTQRNAWWESNTPITIVIPIMKIISKIHSMSSNNDKIRCVQIYICHGYKGESTRSRLESLASLIRSIKYKKSAYC